MNTIQCTIKISKLAVALGIGVTALVVGQFYKISELKAENSMLKKELKHDKEL